MKFTALTRDETEGGGNVTLIALMKGMQDTALIMSSEDIEKLTVWIHQGVVFPIRLKFGAKFATRANPRRPLDIFYAIMVQSGTENV